MATKISIKNLPEGYQSILSNGRHTVIGDEPVASTGTDLGFSPSDFLLSALAFCKAATVRFIARKKGWEIGNVNAELTQEVSRSSAGLSTTVHVSIAIEGDLTDAQRDELLRMADECYIHRQLNGEWNIQAATSPQPVELH